ncbi:HNH endonuclease signature motif containing protein [Rhizobium deserti]
MAVYPSCRRCGQRAALVDHIEPHRGDQELFWRRTNWQPLCTPCHSSAKQSAERRDQKEK